MAARFLLYLSVALGCSACSVVGGQTQLDRYLNGEMPDKKNTAEPFNQDEKSMPDDFESSWMFDDESESKSGSQRMQKNKKQSVGVNGHQKKPTSAADAQSQEDTLALDEPELRCLASDNPSFSYRKRIAILPMTLFQRQDAVDIPFVEREMSQALTFRLAEQERLTPYDASSYHDLQPYSARSRLTKPLDPDLVRATAQELNAQFVVAGNLLDLSFDRTKTNSFELATSLSGWKTLARETYERATDSYWRRLVMELSLYDGPSGALIKRKRYQGEANHSIAVGRHQGLESHSFWQSDYGQLVDKTLNEQALMISRALECLPMRAQVSRVDIDVVEINAGLDANLMPGDRLRIFHREPAGRDPQGVPKHRWKYYGGLTIKGVFPLKSIAVLDDGLAPDVIDLGDIVQAW